MTTVSVQLHKTDMSGVELDIEQLIHEMSQELSTVEL